MNILAIAHFVCAAAFGALAALIAAGRPSNRTAYEALAASLLTAIWAAMVGLSGLGVAGVIPTLDSLRTLSWLVFAGSLLLPSVGGFSKPPAGAIWLIALPVLAVLALAGDVSHFAASPTRLYFTGNQILERIALGVLGVLIVENFYRNSPDEKRWCIAPICIALGGIFVCELVIYSDAFLLRRVDPSLLAARAVANVFAVPLIALAMVRNRNWRVDIHVSRAVVFHSATFIASGVFLLSVVAVGTVFRAYGGSWGVVVQLSLFLGGVLVLAVALTSGGTRSRFKRIIAENFFSNRYDYRVEWVRFIDALSSTKSGDLQERVIRAVADVVDSPAGLLWLVGDEAYRPVASWNMHPPDNARETADGAFVAALNDGEVQRVEALLSGPSAPNWLRQVVTGWLVVPLPHNDRLLGFLVLAKPRAPFKLSLEVFQLLKTIGRQSASYLSEAEATRALADTKLLADYSKRFAFVVHDVKNLVSQLKLVLSNAEKFGAEPAFQQDALLTIRRSVERMNKLLQQLGSNRSPPGVNVSTDVEEVIREVVASAADSRRIVIAVSGAKPRASIDPAAFNSVLAHLVNNALEASGGEQTVRVHVEALSERIMIDVCDEGPGMEPSFIRNELFRPRRSTKESGHGIGAFQSREIVRAVGGDLEVMSRRGGGTTMRIVLPLAKGPSAQVVSAA